MAICSHVFMQLANKRKNTSCRRKMMRKFVCGVSVSRKNDAKIHIWSKCWKENLANANYESLPINQHEDRIPIMRIVENYVANCSTC